MKSVGKIFRVIILMLVLFISALIAPKLTFDDSLRNWIPRGEEIIGDYQAFLKDFRSDALLIVSMSKSSEMMQKSSIPLGILMEQIRKLPHVHTVMHWPPPFLRYKVKPSQNMESFFITYLPPSLWNPNRPDLIQKITNILKASGREFHLAGTGVIHKAINDRTRNATRRFLAIGLTALFLFLLLLTRDVQVVLKTISISLGSVAFMVIAAYLFKIQINMIMSMLPILILFYSSSISVHILNHHNNFKIVFWPTVTAVLTTCAGFSTFLFESAPLLWRFGLLAIVGLIGGFFWAVLLFLPDKNSSQTELPYKNKLVWIKKSWTTKSLWISLILLVFLIPPALRVQSEINPHSLLPVHDRAIRDYLFIEKKVSPYIPIEYRVNLTKARSLDVREWIEAVYQIKEVGAVMSYLAIPPWFNARNLGYISKDGKTGRVTFFIPMMSTSDGLALVQQIDHLSKEKLPNTNVLSSPTGFVALYVSVAQHLAKSFAETLALAFLFVFLIIFVFLRQPKLFGASIFPNLLPVVAILGVMGWSHIPLDMVTFPIGSLAMGIIVDDTIHFLYWYRKTTNLDKVLEKAGPGIIVTSLIFILGFSVFLFSEAPPVRYFGILLITAMITALFGDIVILPIILQRIIRSKK